MIWAIVSSRSCVCWLYRASSSLATKNIIHMTSVLMVWWCPCVESSLVLLEDGVCYDQCVLWQNSVSLCPASFCTSRPNMPVTPVISWLHTFAFQSPMMKRTTFLVLVLEGLIVHYRTIQLQLLWYYWLGHRLELMWYWMVCLGNRDHSVIFETGSNYCISDSFVDYEGYSISSKGYLDTVVDIIVIWIKIAHSSPF